MANKELARIVGIAESTCLERVRALQARGVIRGWHADVDLNALGRPIRAIVSVRLHPKSTSSVHAFREHILSAAETLTIDTVTGTDDFLVEVAVPDVDRLRTFVLEHINSRPDVVDTHTSLVYEHHRKFVIEPLSSDEPQ